MKMVSDSVTCIQEFKRCTSAEGMGHASGVGLYRTQRNGSVYPVVQESCGAAFKTQNL